MSEECQIFFMEPNSPIWLWECGHLSFFFSFLSVPCHFWLSAVFLKGYSGKRRARIYRNTKIHQDKGQHMIHNSCDQWNINNDSKHQKQPRCCLQCCLRHELAIRTAFSFWGQYLAMINILTSLSLPAPTPASNSIRYLTVYLTSKFNSITSSHLAYQVLTVFSKWLQASVLWLMSIISFFFSFFCVFFSFVLFALIFSDSSLQPIALLIRYRKCSGKLLAKYLSKSKSSWLQVPKCSSGQWWLAAV